MVYNRIQVAFGSLRRITGPTISYQYDVQQILVINGLNLPEYYVVDFCNEGDATVIPMTGTSDGVEIPDSLLQTGKPVKAYIVVSSGQGDVQTRYEVKLPVNTRPMRDDIHPTDPQQQQIDALIGALNDGVERAEDAAEQAEESAKLLTNPSAEATTLNPGSQATAEYDEGVFRFGIPSGSGLTDRVKSALLGIFQHVAYADDQGQAYYNELYDVLNSVELTGVEATFNQGTMEVYPSTPLDSLRKNLVVKAVYSNGEKVTIDDYTLSGTLQVGTSTITVTCEDYTDTFDVNVSSVAVTGIECVFNQGTAVVYESDSLTSLKQYLTVEVVYSDGTKEETINYSLSGTLSAGTSIITATYGAFTDTFSVVVSAVTVTSISCVYSQSKTVYDSDSLDVLKDDLVVNAVYSDGSSGTVSASDYTLSGTLNEGTSTITVSYGGKTDTFTVTVTHRVAVHSVTNNLTNCANSNVASTVVDGESYSGTITASSGYTMAGATVLITMGGTDITSTAYSDGTIYIASVSGNIVVNASAVFDFYNTYEWDFASEKPEAIMSRDNGASGSIDLGSEETYRYRPQFMPNSYEIRTAFHVKEGKNGTQVMLDQTTPVSPPRYLIPIPADAIKVIGTITPSSQYFSIREWVYEGNENWTRKTETGWKKGSTTYFLTGSGSNRYISINCKPALDGSIPYDDSTYPRPENFHLEFLTS